MTKVLAEIVFGSSAIHSNWILLLHLPFCLVIMGELRSAEGQISDTLASMMFLTQVLAHFVFFPISPECPLVRRAAVAEMMLSANDVSRGEWFPCAFSNYTSA